MGLDLFLALITLAAFGYWVVWKDWLKPAIFGQSAQSVKSNAGARRPRLRSRRRTLANEANATIPLASAAAGVPNVHPNVHPNGQLESPAGDSSWPDGAMSITPKELTQLAGAISARAGGATVEEALRVGFDVKKGSSKAYTRAKELFDVATAPPPGEG